MPLTLLLGPANCGKVAQLIDRFAEQIDTGAAPTLVVPTRPDVELAERDLLARRSAVLGGMIGSALVGTFLGILLAYGFVEPLGGLMEQKVDEGSKELQCIKTTLLASMQGYAPQVAVEFGRKVLYSGDRPTFIELEGHVKGKK